MAARPYFSRMPDQSLLIDAPEARGEYVAALRDAEGAYALAYVPNAGQTIALDLRALKSDRAVAALKRSNCPRPLIARVSVDTLWFSVSSSSSDRLKSSSLVMA